jgi:hypothetical protein
MEGPYLRLPMQAITDLIRISFAGLKLTLTLRGIWREYYDWERQGGEAHAKTRKTQSGN